MTETFQMNSVSPSNLVGQNKAKNETSEALAWTIARAADDRKGSDILLLKVTEVSYLTDYFVMITGFSRVQVRAIAQSIEQSVAVELQRRPARTEGQTEASWIVQDYGDVIVHILLPQERDFYNLEAFWGHAERINFSAASKPTGE